MIAYLAIAVLSIILIVLCVALVRYEVESQTHEQEKLDMYKAGVNAEIARHTEPSEDFIRPRGVTPTKREAA